MPDSHQPSQPTEFLKQLYTLWYRPRNNPHSMSLVFRHEGDFRAAIQRGPNFCENVNYVFITVKPWYVELTELERKLTLDTNEVPA